MSLRLATLHLMNEFDDNRLISKMATHGFEVFYYVDALTEPILPA